MNKNHSQPKIIRLIRYDDAIIMANMAMICQDRKSQRNM